MSRARRLLAALDYGFIRRIRLDTRVNTELSWENMRSRFSTRSLSAIAVTLVSITLPAHAQFMGIFQGVTNAVGQVTNKLTNRAFAGNGDDLQDARDKFFGQLDAQTAGMDDASKKQYRAAVEKQWPALEQAILLKNAQQQRDKDAPLIDLRQVAGAAVGGVAMQVGMNNAISGAGGGMTDVLRSKAMGGLIDGTQSNVTAALTEGKSPAAVPASAADLDFTPINAVNPLTFLGKHPRDLNAKDLYRENGFIGWKRMEQDSGAEAYAPITGEGQAQYAVFNFDPQTGTTKAAFRVLKASPVAFTSAVTAYSKMLGAEPRYASAGSILRAVWESGAFVAADASKLSAGWSSLVPAVYAASSVGSAAR